MSEKSVPLPVAVTLHDDNGPFELTASVTELKRHQEPGFFGQERIGLYASMTIYIDGEEGNHMSLSRLVHETHWAVDAQTTSDGALHFSHGFGARYLRYKTILPQLSAALDELARERGLAVAIGRDVPLRLAAA